MKKLLTLLVLGLGVLSCRLSADEGMFPISEVANLNLAAKGLQLTPEEIFNADKTCLVDGICRVNGCTGSFVSPKGLIITNHHCAFRAIQSASTTDHDYLKDGFQAGDLSKEIPAAGYTVRVTESFADVSDQVLSVVNDEMDSIGRTKAIDRRRKEIEKAAETSNPKIRAEVAEMFAGKTYVLFQYTYIKDVRLVFAPPSSIGNFGGAIDNWEWPRHTGDFSFMRAYVAPDGSTADYSPNNVPYKPKRFIQVNPAGANESEFVMLLGYPGRTARHKTASFLQYESEVRLPYIVDLYGRQIATMESAGENNREVAIKLLSRIQGLANTEKRSRGQLKGLARARIVAKRKAEEQRLQSFIEQDPDRKRQFGSLLQSIDSTYQSMSETANEEFNISYLQRTSQLLRFASTVYDAAEERQKEDLERETAYMDRNFDQTVRRLTLAQKDLDLATDKIMLQNMMDQIQASGKTVPGLKDQTVEQLFAGSRLHEPKFLSSLLDKSPAELRAMDDTFLQWAIRMYPEVQRLRELSKEREGQLGKLYGDLISIKQQFLRTQFVPDANATLRLTFGTVRGYSPEDAVYKMPATTLSGVVAKTTGVEPFVTPARVLEMHEKQDFGDYLHPKLNDVPVAMLYDTDTTGGNSGSPILDSEGRLVGVNFDRAFEATINDFAWNTNYSRSIGVDIRYVLWITDKVYGAKHLVKEMGLN